MIADTCPDAGTAAPSVLLVDDHQLLLHTITRALAESGIACRALRPQPADALLAAVLDHAPTVVLLDLDLGDGGDGTALIRPITDAGIRVLVLTAQTDHIPLALAIEQGAIGIVSKAAGFDDLLWAIRNAVRAPPTTPTAKMTALLDELAAHRTQVATDHAPFQSLTERERETLAALADGHTVQQIAAGWVVSTATVRSHVQAILTKLGAGSQLQAVVMAERAGWLPRHDDTDRSG